MYDGRRLKERAFMALVVILSVMAVAPLFHIIATVTVKGGGVVLREGLSFFTEAPAPPGSREPGGIGPALLGTLWLAVTASIIGIPLAVLTAVFIVEFKETRLAGLAKIFTNSLLEIPTVLMGMLVYVTLVKAMGGYSLLAGSIALALVMLPYTVTYVERALEGVPRTYKEAGYSLGMTRAQVVFKVSMGVARRGVLAGVLIGLAKVVSETAPLLFTIGSARNTYPTSPGSLLEPGDAVPLLIFQLVQTPYENWHELAWGAAFVLTMIVLAVFIGMRLVVREVHV